MSDKIVVQLGLHKTATTSLQDFLLSNAAILAREGTFYVPLQRMRGDITPLFWCAEKSRRAQLSRFIDGIEKPCLLLSDENILGTPSDIAHGGVYPYARTRIESFCGEHAEKQIVLLLTLRDPYRFLLSMYSEFLRHNEFIPFEHYIGGISLAGFSYRKIFGWLKDLPGNVRTRIVPFEPANGGGVVSIARTLIEECSGPNSAIDPEKFPAEKSRSAYSKEELELAAEIASRADPRVTQFFLNLLDARDKRFGSNKFEPLDSGLVATLNARYQKDLIWFRETALA
ncbi:MAG: hypothetical protein EON58_18785 [Alphaproteobacteria bacterium]|nr:MAG: hypothetical protein EON58_18785 [Alphaproteobacteria bacterium]